VVWGLSYIPLCPSLPTLPCLEVAFLNPARESAEALSAPPRPVGPGIAQLPEAFYAFLVQQIVSVVTI